MMHYEFISEIANKVGNGSRFSVNFEKRTLRVDGKLVDLDDIEVLPIDDDLMLRMIADLYYAYKHSIPSERSESHRKSYFKALPEDELTDTDMMYNASREVARCELEIYVLLRIRSGELHWHDEWGSWFYQSPYDKDLIILRSWVEPKL